MKTHVQHLRQVAHFMSTTIDAGQNSGVAILSRVIEPTEEPLTPEAARTLLAFRFQKIDERRMNQLASKARKGTLSERERNEAEQYNLVGHMLALLQAKARHALNQHGLDSNDA
jgi:hypothetical protein